MRERRRVRGGLAAVELVVLIGLVAVALCVLAPVLNAAQIFARRARTLDNLKMIGLAMHNYASANAVFPMSCLMDPEGKALGVEHSGFTALLPYIEQAPAYNAYNFHWQPFHASNATAVDVKINTYLAVEQKAVDSVPASEVTRFDGTTYTGKNRFGPLHFGFNWGGSHPGWGDDFLKARPPGQYLGVVMTVATAEGSKLRARNIGLADITDGTSFTVAVAEKRASSGWAVGGFGGSEFDAFTSPDYRGDDPRLMRVLAGSGGSAGGTRIVMCDGSARVLSGSLKTTIWYSLLTRSGSEVIPADAFDSSPAAVPDPAAPVPPPEPPTRSVPRKQAFPSTKN